MYDRNHLGLCKVARDSGKVKAGVPEERAPHSAPKTNSDRSAATLEFRLAQEVFGLVKQTCSDGEGEGPLSGKGEGAQPSGVSLPPGNPVLTPPAGL